MLRDGRPVAGEIEGHGWASVALGAGRLLHGRSPASPGEAVLGVDARVAPGTVVDVLLAAGPRRFTVTGVLDRPGLYVSNVDAAELAPGVRVIGLLGDPDVAAVRAAVADDGVVLVGPERSALEPRADARTRWIGTQVLSGMAALAGLVAVFVVASTFGFNVLRRRRELALLRAIGAQPGQVRRLLFGEALLVGLVGAIVGGVVGAVAVTPFGDALVGAGFQPASYRVHWVVWPFVAGVGVGPLVAVGGAWFASRRVTRIRPIEAIREATVDPRPMSTARWVTGIVLGTLGAAAVVATMSSDDLEALALPSLFGTMLLIVAAAVLAPAIVPFTVRAFTWPWSRRAGVTALLVRQEVLADRRRSAATAAPILLSVAFAVLIAGNVATTTQAYAAARGASVNAAAVIVPDGTPGLSDVSVAGVDGTAVVPTSVYLDAYGTATILTAWGVDPASIATTSPRLTVRAGAIARLSEVDSLAVGERLADDQGWQVGDAVEVTLADGLRRALRVVAVVANAPADLLLSRETVRAHDPSALSSAVFVASRPAGDRPGARVVDVATYAAEADAEEDRLVWLFTLLLVGVSAGYGLIAVANTLLMAAAGRRHDQLVLRLTGATLWQVRAAVAAEAGVVVAIGSLLGGAVAFLGLWGADAGLSEQAGAPVELVVPWPAIGIVVCVCLVVAVAASLAPTWSRSGDIVRVGRGA
jgi:putative ABC transport system permease protein